MGGLSEWIKSMIIIIGIVLLAAVANVAAAHDKKRLRNRKVRAAPPARPMTDKERQRLKLMELELPYLDEQIENMRLMVDMLGDMDAIQRDKYAPDEKGLKRIIATTKQLYAIKKQLAALELKREKIIEQLKRL